MKKYLYLQIKRMLRFFPFVLAIALILFAGLTAAFLGLMQIQSESEDAQKFKVGVTGDIDHAYLDMGLAALQTMDSSRFALEIKVMEEDEALQALYRRELAAYFVFPEGFTEAATYGDVRTIRFVALADAGNLVLGFKGEISKAISDYIVSSQKGVYGVQAALDSNGYPDLSYEYLNKINMEYIDLIIHRTDLFEVEELGIANSLPLSDYYLCSLAVFLLLLLGLPYAMVLIKKDHALTRILAAKQFSATKQVVCEYAAYGAMLALLSALVMVTLILGRAGPAAAIGIRLLPVVAMIAAFNLLLFEVSDNLVSGILLQFFGTVSMCYITGCFYPIFSFPETVQKLSAFLPTGLARGYLAAGITGQAGTSALLGVLAYTAALLAATVGIRRYKITGRAG